MSIVAASAVTIASLLATARFAGYLPPQPGPGATTAATASAAPALPAVVLPPATAPEEPPAPAARALSPVRRDAAIPPSHHVEQRRASRDAVHGPAGLVAEAPVGDANARPPAQHSPAYRQSPPLCRECGIIENVREVRRDGDGSGLGGVNGGLLGNQTGGGHGKTVGAVVGNEVEKRRPREASR